MRKVMEHVHNLLTLRKARFVRLVLSNIMLFLAVVASVVVAVVVTSYLKVSAAPKLNCALARLDQGQALETTEELYEAVDLYLNETTRNQTTVYGATPNHWNVSLISNFSWVFAANRNVDYFGITGQGTDYRDFTEDLHCWDTSNAISMSYMFAKSHFNGDISTWDVSGVLDMSHMFWLADSFNRDLSQWNVSSVSSFFWMFAFAKNFNQDLSKWDVSAVIQMNTMFFQAKVFNSDLSSWNVTSVQSANSMFAGADAFNHSLCSWLTKMPLSADLNNTFGDNVVGGKAASCPNTTEPNTTDLNLRLKGPMCWVCSLG